MSERCLNQIFRPREGYIDGGGIDGWGDCYRCKYDPINNPKCKGYTPVEIIIIEWEVKDEDVKRDRRTF